MEQLFITNLTIQKVRNLKNISIPLCDSQIRHLILTGKNGSGKTSVIEALADGLDNIFTDEFVIEKGKDVRQSTNGLEIQFKRKADSILAATENSYCPEYQKPASDACSGYVFAYYSADRIFEAIQPAYVEKVQLKDEYGLREFPRHEFVKYLLDLKMTEALAESKGRREKAEEIKTWFEHLEQLLKRIFSDESVRLVFDEDTFRFHILQNGKEPFDFHTLSGGYQAVLDIVLDIMMRMQNRIQRSFDFNLPGIVLIDEIETHLHLELQKSMMPLLTALFPNIQFIVTTHSPFILNSLENVVIYDLENHILVEHGLDNVPYDGIVEGYFGADRLSGVLKEKFGRFKDLVEKKDLSDDEINEIAGLELYLDEIPDYLSIGIATEYQRLKLEFMKW